MASTERHPDQPQPAGGFSPSARYVRPVLAGLLLIVVLAGVRADRPAVQGTGPWHRDVLALAAAAEAVLAVLLIALWVITRRRPKPGYPAAVLRAGLLRVILLAMTGVAILAGLSRLQLHPRPSARSGRPVQPKPPPLGLVQKATAHNPPSLAYVSYALLGLLLLTAIVACIVVIRRLPRAGSAAPALELPDDDDALMRGAVESGRQALRSFDDAQAAIIACYVAMEASLAGAGTARRAAETPDELLVRAVESGLLQGAAAVRLTALFYEARYSSHTLPPAARQEAMQALDTISAELARSEAGGSVSGTPAAGVAP